MTYGQTLVDMLKGSTELPETSAELLNILTGGIYVFQDSGRKGMNRIQTMEAYIKETGILKPTCVIYEAEARFDGVAADAATGFRTTTTPILGWIYDDGDAGYDTIAAAEALMYLLLNGKSIQDGFQFLWGHTLQNKREPYLEDACYFQFDGTVYGYRRNS